MRGTGDIQVVLYTCTEVDGVPGRQIPGKGEQPRETKITLHVLALEV